MDSLAWTRKVFIKPELDASPNRRVTDDKMDEVGMDENHLDAKIINKLQRWILV